MNIILWTVYTLVAYNLIGNLSNDMYLPSLPFLLKEFNTTESLVKFSYSIWFIGAAIGQIICAILFSVYNRKLIFFLSGIIFCSASLSCVAAESIYQLMAGRFFQGASFSACNILVFMEIQANFSHKGQQKLFTINNMLGILSPIIGPALGVYFIINYSWHHIFYFIAFSAIFVLIICITSYSSLVVQNGDNESSTPDKFRNILSEYLGAFANLKFMAISFTPGLVMCSMASYLLLCSFIFLNEFKIPLESFGYYHSSIIISYIFGMWLSYKFRPINIVSLVNIGCFFALFGAAGIIIGRYLNGGLMAFYLVVIIIIMMSLAGFGYVLNPLIVNAMNKAKHKAVGSSIICVIASLACSIYTSILSAIPYDKLLSLGIILFINAVLINITCRFSED